MLDLVQSNQIFAENVAIQRSLLCTCNFYWQIEVLLLAQFLKDLVLQCRCCMFEVKLTLAYLSLNILCFDVRVVLFSLSLHTEFTRFFVYLYFLKVIEYVTLFLLGDFFNDGKNLLTKIKAEFCVSFKGKF